MLPFPPLSASQAERTKLSRPTASSPTASLVICFSSSGSTGCQGGDWLRLRRDVEAKQVRVVALNLPTSWMLAAPADEIAARMFGAINAMLFDVLAAVARKDHDDSRKGRVRKHLQRTRPAITGSPPSARGPVLQRHRPLMAAAGLRWPRLRNGRQRRPDGACLGRTTTHTLRRTVARAYFRVVSLQTHRMPFAAPLVHWSTLSGL